MKTLMTLLFVNLIKRINANKYCAFELDGEAKYYVCPRNEYCCNFGCCVNIAFQFYQLWYYWLLIIFMFLICSGGGWWYRFCRPNASQYPNGSLGSNNSSTSAALLYGSGSGSTRNSPLHDRNRSRNSYQRRCDYQQQQPRHSVSSSASHRTARRASYGRGRSCSLITRQNHRGRDDQTFYLQRIWKAPSNISTRHHPSPTDPPNATLPPPPNYFATASDSITASNHIPNNYLPTSTMPTDLDLINNYLQCPYYQLYGPPPSYDSIVQLSDEQNHPQCVLMCTTSLVDEQPSSSTACPTSTVTTTPQQLTLVIGENGQILNTTTTATATSPEHFCEMQQHTGQTPDIECANNQNSFELDSLQPSILLKRTENPMRNLQSRNQQNESNCVSIELDEDTDVSPFNGDHRRASSIRHHAQQMTEHQQQPSTSSASTNTN